jgi:hypothetical protein
MADARTQAVAQRRNLLNIEAEYLAAIQRLQRAAALTRREIEKLESEYGMNDSQYHKIVMQAKEAPIAHVQKS